MAKGLAGRSPLIVEGWVWAGEYRNVASLVPGLSQRCCLCAEISVMWNGRGLWFEAMRGRMFWGVYGGMTMLLGDDGALSRGLQDAFAGWGVAKFCRRK